MVLGGDVRVAGADVEDVGGGGRGRGEDPGVQGVAESLVDEEVLGVESEIRSETGEGEGWSERTSGILECLERAHSLCRRYCDGKTWLGGIGGDQRVSMSLSKPQCFHGL